MPDGARGDVEQMLVHNLRTPLTGLLATLEMLDDGDFGALAPAQRDAVARMRAQGGELMALIDELLETWRMEAPAIRLRPERVDLGALLRDVVSEWRSRLGGRLLLEEATTVQPARCDPAIMRRVLGNLLLNAVVHGGDGVSVRLVAGSEGGSVLVDVSDDGPGVAEADAGRIFEKFVRGGEAAERRPSRGNGLGLAYCRAAMEAQGGGIALRAEPGRRGATFRLALPAAGDGDAP